MLACWHAPKEFPRMAHIIGLIAQKGGVGKSTLSRLIAREFAGL